MMAKPRVADVENERTEDVVRRRKRKQSRYCLTRRGINLFELVKEFGEW